MATARLCFATFIAVVVMKMAAATQGEETNWLTSDIDGSTTIPDQTTTESDPNPNSDFLKQLTEKFFKQGDSVLKSMQTYLVKFQQLVSAGSNSPDPVPITREAGVMRTPSGGVTTPGGDPEKRSSTPPVSKNDILREIIRRIREEAAGYPLELPIGMRFIEQPGTTLQTYNSDVPEKRDADRDAVRDEILRRLLELQRVKLPGMRAGK